MKRVLLAIIAVCILLCFAGCGKSSGDEVENTGVPTMPIVTTTLPDKTTVAPDADSNKVVLAKIGFEEIMNYLNICESYGVPVEVNENDTIGDIVEKMRADGSVVFVNNIKESARFFDYAMLNPNYSNGGGLYALKADVDWLALYAD